MDFNLSPERRQLRSDVREWSKQHRDEIAEHDRESTFPDEIYCDGMERGFGTAILPEEYGGLGGDAMEYALVSEETGIFQISFQMQRALLAVGTDEQRDRYLPGFADGDSVGAISISEPSTGSSLRTMGTVAVRDGEEFVLDGVKSHVNLAAEADVHKVYAMADEGLTAFVVEGDNPGLRVTEKRDPIGTRYLPIYDLELDDCRVNASQVLGELGDGYKVFFETFNFSRIGNASEMLGHGKRALRDATKWASDREVGDDVVTDFQGIRWKVAELHTQLRAAERLRDEAAWRLDQGEDGTLATSIAKLACANAALPATTEAMQITGAHGLYRDQPYEAHFRNVKTLEVAGGSREIMKNVIADSILNDDGYDVFK